jgi:heme/copper-type cytochrome/quinol oxidase subunit 2
MQSDIRNIMVDGNHGESTIGNTLASVFSCCCSSISIRPNRSKILGDEIMNLIYPFIVVLGTIGVFIFSMIHLFLFEHRRETKKGKNQ